MCEFFVKADPILYEQRTRTIRIHGVLTSIRLENMVWDTLAEMAAAEDRTTNALIVQLHDEIVAHRGEVTAHSGRARSSVPLRRVRGVRGRDRDRAHPRRLCSRQGRPQAAWG